MARRLTPAGDPRLAVCYARVSKEEQDLGPEAQRTSMAAWCKARGVTAVAWLEERVSGAAKLDDRPVMLGAMHTLEVHKAGIFLVAKRDRLARDPIVAAMIEAAVARVGAKVVSAAGEGEGDDPTSVLMRRIVDAFAEYERLIIRHRTRAALAVKKTRGELTGTAPYGWRIAPGDVVPRRLERDSAEQAIVVMAKKLRKDGATLRAVAAELQSRGFRPREGKEWFPETVKRLLRAD